MRKTHGCPVQHSHPDDWPLTGYSLGLLTAANDLYILYIIEHLYQSKGRSNPLYIKYAQCGSSNAHYMNDGFMYYMPMPRSKNIYYSGGHAPCRIFFSFHFLSCCEREYRKSRTSTAATSAALKENKSRTLMDHSGARRSYRQYGFRSAVAFTSFAPELSKYYTV